MNELICHLLGDYVLQTEQMALRKTRSWAWAIFHAAVYSIPFLLLIHTWEAWVVIFGTHAVIDRYRLSNSVCRFKNAFWFGPGRPEVNPETGYSKDTPAHVDFWLVVIVDNTVHMIINHLSLLYLNGPGI